MLGFLRVLPHRSQRHSPKQPGIRAALVATVTSCPVSGVHSLQLQPLAGLLAHLPMPHASVACLQCRWTPPAPSGSV